MIDDGRCPAESRDDWPERRGPQGVISLVVALAVVVMLIVSALAAAARADGPFGELRGCESGHLAYDAATGNGFWGAYQFTRQTWDGVAREVEPEWVGVRPDLAPPQVQDRMAFALAFVVSWGGRGHWPVCGRHLAGVSSASARAGLTPPPSTGHYGRRTDTHLECEVDGLPGEERVVVRGNRWFVDLDHRGGDGELVIGFGTATDSPACVDLDGDGIDEPVVHRPGAGYWRATWTTGPGQELDAAQCAATGCSELD